MLALPLVLMDAHFDSVVGTSFGLLTLLLLQARCRQTGGGRVGDLMGDRFVEPSARTSRRQADRRRCAPSAAPFA